MRKAKIWLMVGAAPVATMLSTSAMARDCGTLTGMALDHGKVMSAELVTQGTFEPPATPFGPPPGVASAAYKALPTFCRVRATLQPTSDSDIKVEIWLPATGWNGKFVGIGNGVWAGQVSYSQMGEPLGRGYAVASTDTGHSGSGLTAEWAVGHPEKLVDFGHRAVHLMTVTAKQAAEDFYGMAPKLSLWNSCSTGGRQGLMAAYRYPQDYDAISAMAPANPMTDLMVQSMWAGFQPKRTPSATLTPALLGLIHNAVVAQCDALDGLRDGLIGRPRACRFKAAALLCKPGRKGDCLNADQAGAMQAIYDGVRDAGGKPLLPGWPVGSEMQLAALMMGPEPFPVATDYFRLLVHGDQNDWDWRAMDYAREIAAARSYGAGILNVPSNGLAAFFARGGKLLLSHGWTDGLIPANNTIAFYESLKSGAPADQLRLFMVPGMDHCAGGEGASAFDTLDTIDRWASGGAAPERILAHRGPAMPGAPTLPPLSRPLCPFPQVAQYKGSGDQNDAANFRCAAMK
ncbi:tannase/feruloyl esterase family alpha/beta hydrolase [Sphingobium nicotianae]|uniref:Tannase/feruloyl esterase family alpha/beta hydrolase n=1 Tax=Sphingobium nicotianae TaxID=2782607 RepID=A0A9X1DE75_9SPHN|nr:tannase/feruloyl esterase family alpha/beta hydrolase [Sphingobium nicotianae]MBT2188300.1 tannase/feruloyl esterase family alpha/beta hydrolase [Sphingobium nicotianae]